MECKKCHSKLMIYLEGGLEEQEQKDIARHLEACSDCHNFAEHLKTTLDIIQVEKQIKPDPFLYTRVMAKLEFGSKVLPTRLFPSFRWIQAVAAGLVLLLGVFGGIGLGKSLIVGENQHYKAISELQSLVNDMDQEPLEQFLMGF